ncbi:hypothetical protein LLEC1_07403 [Akanthomyces lecanii]|uniref:Transcription factor domain-containing protein n=1 Tax=Cordyceps confragosa TaxID=2714763 RepID=A0A179I903_CORDF|nr:hypothetical protein LLEC1_07403 [Akanthomyces lecanii]
MSVINASTTRGNTPASALNKPGAGQEPAVLQSPPTSTSTASPPYSTGSGHVYTARLPMRGHKCSVCQARPSTRHTARAASSSSISNGKKPVSRLQDIYPSQDFGFVCLLTGIPHFSDGCEEWVRLRTGLTPQFDFPSFQRCSLDELSPLAASRTMLPPRWACDAMIYALTKSDLILIFPVVDEVLIEETVNLVYATNGTPSLPHISAKACVLALLTLTSLHFPEVKATKYVDIAGFAKAAKLLIAECLEDTSLTTLQTYCLVVRHSHLYIVPWNYPYLLLTTLLQMMYDMTAGRMQAAAMYNALACRASDAELLRTIRELDDELESWRSAVPREFAPQLSVRKDVSLAGDLSRSMTMFHLELHLEYHHILMVIHGASGLSAAANAPTGTILPGVQSSLELSVEASRSTIIYLTASANRIASEAFWAFIFYPMSALMTLFFSILRRPRGEDTLQDLDLIFKSLSIVRTMPIHVTVPFATEYLARVDAFVKELHRLAKGAIERAAREDLNNAIL